MLVRTDKFRASRIMEERVRKTENIDILVNTSTVEVLGDGQVVTAVKVKNSVTGEEKEIPATGFFVAIGHKPNTDIFADFILQLLQQENELSQQEKKLIEEVDKNGTEPLNENQTDFLKNIVSRYSKKCEVCNEEIPLNEVFHLGKYCSNHDYLNDEEK